MRVTLLIAILAVGLSASGAMAATATCGGLVQDAQSNERIAKDGAERVAHQSVPVTATDRDYQLVKVIDAALVGRAALAACTAPEDKIAVSDVHVWQAVQEAAVSSALADADNCRTVLYVVQTILDGAQKQDGGDARSGYLVNSALVTNEAARKSCPAFAANEDDFARTGAKWSVPGAKP